MPPLITQVALQTPLRYQWFATLVDERDLNGRNYVQFRLLTFIEGLILEAELGTYTAATDQEELAITEFNRFMGDRHSLALQSYKKELRGIPVTMKTAEEMEREKEIVNLQGFREQIKGPFRFHDKQRQLFQPPSYWYRAGGLWRTSEDLTPVQATILMEQAVALKLARVEAAMQLAIGNRVASTQARLTLPERVRAEVWRRDEGKCTRCGSRKDLEFDHIIPFSKGGSSTARNIELLCQICNRSKGNRI